MSDPNLGPEVQRLEEQFSAHPGSLLFARLADLLRKSGELDRALAVVEEGLAEHPDYLSAHIVHARTLEDMGRGVQAGRAYRGVLELDGQNLVALRALARMAEASGDREGAAEWYERLLAVDPRNEEAEAALESLVGAPEPNAEPEPEAAVLEPEPEAEGALEPEAAVELEPEAGYAPDVDAGSEAGPMDAFGLASDAFGLESGPDTEWESIGSSGWPWKEAEEQDGPETGATVAGREPESDVEEARTSTGEDLPDLPGMAETIESTEALWPAWGGEAVESGLSWAEADEDTYGEPEPVEGLEPAGAPEPAAVEEPEPIELAFVEAQPEPEPEPEAAEPDDRSGTDLPTETLATLYATQGLYREAVTIYEELVRRRPHDEALAERLRAAREELGSDEPQAPGAGAGAGPASQEAWSARETQATEHVAPEEPPVRDHLRALLSGEAVPDTQRREGSE